MHVPCVFWNRLSVHQRFMYVDKQAAGIRGGASSCKRMRLRKKDSAMRRGYGMGRMRARQRDARARRMESGEGKALVVL